MYLARCGVASRRAAERLIAAGRVAVNGALVTAPGSSVDPTRDEVRVDGRLVRCRGRSVYYAVNKPPGVVSSARDPRGRPVVTGLVRTSERVFPVGRLDVDSEGLILLTNDGEIALRLTHPRYQVEKEYHALVRGVPTEKTMRWLEEGVALEDGMARAASARLVRALEGNAWVAIVLREGRKRQVRRMLEVVGHPVLRLVRVRIDGVTLGDLRLGQARRLTRAEIQALRAASRG